VKTDKRYWRADLHVDFCALDQFRGFGLTTPTLRQPREKLSLQAIFEAVLERLSIPNKRPAKLAKLRVFYLGVDKRLILFWVRFFGHCCINLTAVCFRLASHSPVTSGHPGISFLSMTPKARDASDWDLHFLGELALFLGFCMLGALAPTG
jgi:hypothetical protein